MTDHALVASRLDRLPSPPFPRLQSLIATIKPGKDPIDFSIGEPRHDAQAWPCQRLSLVIRFRHLAPIFACPRPNVGISRTTRNNKFLVAFLNLTFARRDCGIGDTNVKFTPLDPNWLTTHTGILPLAATREGLFMAVLAAVRAHQSEARPALLLPKNR